MWLAPEQFFIDRHVPGDHARDVVLLAGSLLGPRAEVASTRRRPPTNPRCSSGGRGGAGDRRRRDVLLAREACPPGRPARQWLNARRAVMPTPPRRSHAL